MEKIIKIMMERDGISWEEAHDICCYALDEMEQLKYDPDICQDIFESQIGLEVDYLVDFLL